MWKTSVEESCSGLPVLFSVCNKLMCGWRFVLCLPVIGAPHIPCRYMFDEPSSYLDVKQRLKAAVAIRHLLGADR